jgi:hypothetical protein
VVFVPAIGVPLCGSFGRPASRLIDFCFRRFMSKTWYKSTKGRFDENNNAIAWNMSPVGPKPTFQKPPIVRLSG